MTVLLYKDAVGVTKELKSSLDGTAHVVHHNTDALPLAFTLDTGSIKTAVQALAALITSGRLPVSLSATVEGYLDGLEGFLSTLAGAVTSSRVAVNVDSTTTGKLDTIIAPPSATYGGKTVVTTAGTRVVLGSSQALTDGLWIRALDANAGLIYPGNSSVSATTGGTRLAAKEPVWVRCSNVNQIYIDAASNGEGVTWWGW